MQNPLKSSSHAVLAKSTFGLGMTARGEMQRPQSYSQTFLMPAAPLEYAPGRQRRKGSLWCACGSWGRGGTDRLSGSARPEMYRRPTAEIHARAPGVQSGLAVPKQSLNDASWSVQDHFRD